MTSTVPQRIPMPYKFLIGLALKNNEELLAKDICKFILVHMPRICTLKNNNWENAVRNNLTIYDCFVNREVILPRGKPLNYYRFAEGAKEKFDEEYSFEFGFPYAFLANRENHDKIYHGKIGFPTQEEVKLARATFEDVKRRYALLNEENNDESQKNVKKSKAPMKEESKEVVLALCENQMAQYDFGSYHQEVVGPMRPEVPSNYGARMTPYHRQSPLLQEQPMQQSSGLPSISYFFQPREMAPIQPDAENVELSPPFSQENAELSPAPSPQMHSEAYQEYLELANAPLPQMSDADYALYSKFFPTEHPSPVENSIADSIFSYDLDFAFLCKCSLY